MLYMCPVNETNDEWETRDIYLMQNRVHFLALRAETDKSGLRIDYTTRTERFVMSGFDLYAKRNNISIFPDIFFTGEKIPVEIYESPRREDKTRKKFALRARIFRERHTINHVPLAIGLQTCATESFSSNDGLKISTNYSEKPDNEYSNREKCS